MTNETPASTDFIHEAVAEDLRTGRFDHVKTRLPPEPNGYLHIGHVKAFLIDYNTAKDFGGVLDLRFDDTNPEKEETEFVDAIQDDARWLGIQWEQVLFASDFFDLLYEWAVKLVKKGKAYVDDQSPDEVKANRGSWTEPGVDSPWRNRSVEENLDLLERMKNGEFPDGSRVLRAKIDMAHGNMNMRDPIMLPHPARTATSPHRQQVVHLSHVRLGARPERRHARRHPFALFDRIRAPSPAVRMVPQRAGNREQTAPDRVRPFEHDLYCLEQTQAAPPGGRRVC